MDVCFGGTNDVQLLALSDLKIRFHVTARVDDNRLAGLLAADEIGGVRERPIVEVFE
jgi:hypothetical protein